MADLVVYDIKKYLTSLTATASICVTLERTLIASTNLFVYVEPTNATNCMTLIPFSGGPPNLDKIRHESYVQIRLKTKNVKKTMETLQDTINKLHCNEDVCSSCNGKIFAMQSAPMLLEFAEGGEYAIGVANFQVKHTKLS